MTDAGFLEAIAEASDDDTPRLIYADWLSDQDNPHGEFIRCQVQLARMDEADPRYPGLLARGRRCGMLTDREPRVWVANVPDGRVMFRRGTIAGVRIPTVRYLEHPSEAWRQLPLEQLWLEPQANVGATLAARPDLAQVRLLCLESWPRADLEPLLTGCPHLTELAALRFSLDEDAYPQELCRKLHLPALDSFRYHGLTHTWEPLVSRCSHPLQRIHLSRDAESDDDLEESRDWYWLRKTPHWRHLTYAALWRRLDGGDNTPRFPGLADALSSSRLRYLLLNPEQLDDLVRCRSWNCLRTLQLSFLPEGIDASGLARAKQAEQLRSLRLGSWRLTSPGKQVLWAPFLANLRRLSVSCMDASEFLDLLSGPYCPNLLRLDVSAYLESRNVAALADAPLPQLRRLTLGGYGKVDLRPLCRARNLSNLCTLVLTGHWHVGADHLRQLATAPGLPHLSLVGAGGRWWVLGDGEAKPVRTDILPLECDWWEWNPDRDW